MSNTCNNCERAFEAYQASTDHPYHYTESGLPNIWLLGITVFACPNCDVASADIPNLDGLHDLIARDIILTPLPMTGPELRFLRKETRLKPKDFAERLGVDPKTISNWEASEELSRQNDTTVRLTVATELWHGTELLNILSQFSEIAKYSWEEESPEELAKDVAQLAAENTVLGFTFNQGWAIA